MRLEKGLFMAEAEGYLNTKESLIKKLIKEFVKYHNNGFNINNPDIQNEIYDVCGADYLTDRDCERIKREVEKKINK